MKDLFRQTSQSLKDKTYGQVIVDMPWKKAVRYWVSYIVLFAAFYALIVIGLGTYALPQLPKFARENLPSGEFKISSGVATSTLDRSTLIQSNDFTLTIDPKAQIDNPENLPFGIFIAKDKMYYISPDSPVQSYPLSDLPDVSLSKDAISSWLKSHQLQLWLGLIIATLVLGLLITAIYILFQLISMFIWTAIFWLLAKIIHLPTTYANLFKLVCFASVPWFIIANLIGVYPAGILNLLNLVVFIVLTLRWLNNLPLKNPVKSPKLKS